MSEAGSSSKSSQKGSKKTGSITIPFDQWRDVCQKQTDHGDKEALRSESKKLFQNLIQSAQVQAPSSTDVASSSSVVLTTKSSHNEALAQLIKELGPALTTGTSTVTTSTTHVTRIWALWCICGALEGIAAGLVSVSDSVRELLSKFLMELCGPLEEEDVEGTEEVVRDAAILCLTALFQCQPEASSTASSLELSLQSVQRGVERRCASSEEDDSMNAGYDHGYGGYPTSDDIRGGLSSLPRSRRSLCFDLVEAGVDCVRHYNADQVNSEVLSPLGKFASFAANCLQGESDPRCLQQLLNMIHKLQRVFLVFYQKHHNIKGSNEDSFPMLDIFDAVALYYPIQFTPPPNDKFGITREGLSTRLMKILCFVRLDQFSNEQQTMLNLTAGIFLERLLPTEEESDVEVVDKLEGLNDLTLLLFPTEDGTSSNVSDLVEATVREMTVALIATHTTSSIDASKSKSEEKRQQNKLLAEGCRDFVSRVAYALESSLGSASNLWRIFVSSPIAKNSPLLSTSTQSMEGRTALAYIACLASSGGPKTLRLCLDTCFPLLLQALSPSDGDDEKTAAAAYGIAALCSSYNVCYGKAFKVGISWSPHPLTEFSNVAVQTLSKTKTTGLPTSTQIGFIRALESVLNVVPSSLLSAENVTRVEEFVRYLFDLVSGKEEADDDAKACASKTLGYIIGQSMLESVPDVMAPSILRETCALSSYVKTEVMSDLLRAAVKNDVHDSCLDTLVNASLDNRTVAESLISVLASSLCKAIEEGATDLDNTIRDAKKIYHVILKGGRNAINAFYQDERLVITLLLNLAGDHRDMDSKASHSRRGLTTGMSNLALPATEEQNKLVTDRIQFALATLPYLIPVFQNEVPERILKQIVAEVERVLPPLSEDQNARLCVFLPVLATCLSSRMESSGLRNEVVSLLPGLVSFAIDSDYNTQARIAASRSAWTVVMKYHPEDGKCLVKETMRSILMPALVSAVQDMKDTMDRTPGMDRIRRTVREILQVIASFGAAASVRSKSSLATSKLLTSFLLDVVCATLKTIPFIDLQDKEVVNTFVEYTGLFCSDAFGSMLSIETGSPFWRQRIVHIASKGLLKAVAQLKDLSGPTTPISVSQACLLGHLVCNANLSAISKSDVEQMSYELFRVLVSMFPLQSETLESTPVYDTSESIANKELCLAAYLKLMECSSESVTRHFPFVIATFLRSFPLRDTQAGRGTRYLRIQLLALQALVSATRMSSPGPQSLLKLKSAVVTVLSQSLTHPSYILREALVKTINTWSSL